MVHNFVTAESYLAGGKSKDNRPLENNTRLIRLNNDEIAVRLHDTDVVTYRRNGEIVLNSGGWRTVTTKDRINNYAPVRVYSEKGVWKVAVYHSDMGLLEDQTDFYDGVVVDSAGALVSSVLEIDDKPRKVMEKRIKRYVDGFVKKFNHGMPAPSGGDCWYCLFRGVDGRTWGDMGDHTHLLNHMKEKYYVPTLLLNALKERKYVMPDVIANIRGDKMGGDTLMGSDAVRSALTRYLKRRLIPDANGSSPV